LFWQHLDLVVAGFADPAPEGMMTKLPVGERRKRIYPLPALL
jgi:hypothetical protein